MRARPCRAAAQKRLPGGGGFGGEESGQRGGAKRREAKKQWEFVPRPGLDETGSSLDPDEGEVSRA